jgi:hypothetical protein
VICYGLFYYVSYAKLFPTPNNRWGWTWTGFLGELHEQVLSVPNCWCYTVRESKRAFWNNQNNECYIFTLLTGVYLANWFSICRLVLLVVYYFDMDDEWLGEPLTTCYMCSMTTFVSYSITFPHKLYFVGICDLIGNSIPSDLKATNHLLSIFLEVCQLSKKNWI